jgi:general secretion pathway protein L
MSTLLRLFIAGDWPAHATASEWALYDTKRQLLQRGSSEPRHWPAAVECELVLSAEQCLTLEAKLPKGWKSGERVGMKGGVKGHATAGAGSGDVLAYAVEERLVDDVEHEHFVAGKTRADGQTPVWVVGRGRLRAVLTALQQLGRAPRRAFSELQFAPLTPGRWSACLRGSDGFVRTGSEAGFALDDVRSAPPVMLGLALQAARKAGTAPGSIDVYCAQGIDFDVTAWQGALGIPVRLAGEYAWRNASAETARNLLVGEFAPAGEQGAAWTAFKPALAIGASALVVYLVFSIGDWIWLDHTAGGLRMRALEVFRAAFPQVQTVVDPSLQMQRLYDQLKRERGQLGESDFLPLLATVSDALAGEGRYRSIGYEDGRLELTVALPDADAVERLRDALARRGLAPTLRESRPAGAGIEASLSVRWGL